VSAGEIPPRRFPPPVRLDLRQPALEYWRARAEQHVQDAYVGVPMSKFPEDLRVYEHILWEWAPAVVIEIGTQFGGSALWFRDRLRLLEHYGRIDAPRVISVDLDVAAARAALEGVDSGYGRTITLIEADVRDPALPERVAAFVPSGARCLVVEDGAHLYETTTAALSGFARFVGVGGYFVVEDGCVDVDEMRISESWPRGVLPAVRHWLATDEGRRFDVRRDLELYGMSCHPYGFLQRVR
jgi:cephalosporin hydroxylase